MEAPEEQGAMSGQTVGAEAGSGGE